MTETDTYGSRPTMTDDDRKAIMREAVAQASIPKGMHSDWAELQAAIQNPQPNASANTGKFSYNYASLDSILAAVRPLLTKHGFGITQDTVSAMVEGVAMVGVRTTIRHLSGQAMEFGPLYLPAGPNAQTAGSAITYARRYAIAAALNIATEQDDDGKRASVPSAQARKGTKAEQDWGRENPTPESGSTPAGEGDPKAPAPVDGGGGIPGEGPEPAIPTLIAVAQAAGLTKAKLLTRAKVIYPTLGLRSADDLTDVQLLAVLQSEGLNP